MGEKIKMNIVEKKTRNHVAPQTLLEVLLTELMNTLFFFSYQLLFLHEIIFKIIAYWMVV
jgi:hypothetical protein